MRRPVTLLVLAALLAVLLIGVPRGRGGADRAAARAAPSGMQAGVYPTPVLTGADTAAFQLS